MTTRKETTATVAAGLMPVDPIKPPAPWRGGKHYLAKRLIERIKAIPHRTYCEPFLGMGGVFFKRRNRSPIEVINDKHGEVVNLFRMIKYHPEAVNAELFLMGPGREVFERLKATPPECLTEIQRAARFLCLQRQVFGGKPDGVFGVHKEGWQQFTIDKVRSSIDAIYTRLKAVVIEKLDYADFIRRYDYPEALFYLDPPYWGTENSYGKDLFSRDDFARLADILASLKGRFVLSINPAARAVFDAFETEEVATRYTINQKEQHRVTELIVTGGGGDGQ